MQKKKILIIGGHGAMGKMIQNFLNAETYIVTPFGEDDWADKTHLLAEQDLVLISVPIHITEATIKRAAQYIKPSTILADFTSIKQAPLKQMLNSHNGPVLGLHPIFGPGINSSKNQVIVYCDGRDSEAYQWVIKMFQDAGFHLEKMTAHEHDEKMSFVQGVEHFSVFCLGRFLNHKNMDPEQLTKLASPVYRMELNIVGRLFNQAPELYADIIMSDEERIKLIGEFIELINKEYQSLLTGNRNNFISKFNDTKKWMGSFTKSAYHDSNDFLNTSK